jgi:threonine synthase
MRYISTRGEAPSLDFVDVMLAGLARDGGLYVPERWPTLDRATVGNFAGKPYAEVAVEVIRPFVGDGIAEADLARMAREAYGNFRHPAVAPLTQLDPSLFVLELFHGPTLAFKDLAMQFVARLMDHVLHQRAERTTIVVATSGDTGGAAVEAFRGRAQADVVVFFPQGRISEVQRRMMSTVPDSNVHTLAIEGTFDDCQALVKAMFNHHAFRDRVRLSGVNSINWARVAIQVVYYFTAAVATNVNDILVRTFATGTYEVREVVATTSPSMDIQVSSNFERLLFDANGRDAQAVRALMASLAQHRRFALSASAIKELRSLFTADRADEQESAAEIRAWVREADYCVDPHTAVALAVAEKEKRDPSVPMVVLSTAHPAKFPDAVKAACGITPALPDTLADLGRREERIVVLPADQTAVEKYVTSVSRAAREGAAA